MRALFFCVCSFFFTLVENNTLPKEIRCRFCLSQGYRYAVWLSRNSKQKPSLTSHCQLAHSLHCSPGTLVVRCIMNSHFFIHWDVIPSPHSGSIDTFSSLITATETQTHVPASLRHAYLIPSNSHDSWEDTRPCPSGTLSCLRCGNKKPRELEKLV